MIKAIIFDCFGVIISDALQVLSDELRLKNPDAADQLSEIVKLMNTGLIKPEIGRQRLADALGMNLETLREKIAEGEIKNQKLMSYIGLLRQNYKIGMLSNIPSGSLDRRFTNEELVKYFDVVVASGDIGYAKPEAQSYEYVANQLGVRLDECVFIDDRVRYCEGATSTGMQAIQYVNFQQLKAELEQILSHS